VIVLSILALLLLAGVIALIPLGLRAGDGPSDVLLLDVEPRIAPRGATVTVSNRGASPVLLGLSVRRAGPRLRLEGGTYVRIRTGRTTSDLRADQQTLVGVLDAGETETYPVPAGVRVRRRAELVAVVGQHERLRSIHRLVVLAEPSGADRLGRFDQTRDQVGEAGLQPFER
jgi:hypothetical protein